MPNTWLRSDLQGLKDGINTSFTISQFFGGPPSLLVIYNTRILYPALSGSPGPQEFTISGNVITLGRAPQFNDHIFAVYIPTALPPSDYLPRQQRNTFYYTVELRNKSGELLEVLQKDISRLDWEYRPIGGCGECTLNLTRLFDDFKDIQRDYDIQIWQEPDPLGTTGAALPAQLPFALGGILAGTRDLRYSGFIRVFQPILSGPESVVLQCSGYARQLEYLMLPTQTYTSMDVGAIARSIIDTWVTPKSKILRTTGLNLVQDTGISATELHFNSSVFEALRNLADIGGNVEWGVRADKEIYFLPRVSTVKQTHVIGNRVKFFEYGESSDDEVNRVYLQGGAGFTAQLDRSTAPETGFHKERIVQISAIRNAADATLWGNGYFAKFGTPAIRGRLTIGSTDDSVESVGHALGLLRVFGGPTFISGGTALPAQLPFELAKVMGGITDKSFRPGAIHYTPSENELEIDIELGERGSAMADIFRGLEFKISELRQQGV